ncbi:MAG TPA: class I SAM-dependent methyltransferase [Bryobacteraceae bacterium]|nr:class I SAM-dependent methyltransferase [Bryobacteraceae bacterium]
MPTNVEAHWENVFGSKAADQVSWYRPHLEISLDLIERRAPERSAAIIDVGAGESTLVDDLLARGYRDLTVLDVSHTAIDATRKRLGSAADRVRWITGDITRADLASGSFDVWHDRAVFHFLTDPGERKLYVDSVLKAVKRGGHVIVSTFGPQGPVKCSGLDVMRYDAHALHDQFGKRFRIEESTEELHHTPWGTAQQFVYCCCFVE